MLRFVLVVAVCFLVGCDAGVFTEDGQPFAASEVDPQPVPTAGYADLAASVEYPRLAREAGVEGRVTVQADILPDEVRGVQALSSPSDLLSQAAVEAVREATWTPGRMGSREVATRIRVCIDFLLDGEQGRVEASGCSV